MYSVVVLIIAFLSFLWLDLPAAYFFDKFSLLRSICRYYTNLSLPELHLILSCSGFVISRFSERTRDYSMLMFQYALSIGFIMFVCGVLKLTVARARPGLLINEGFSGFAFGNFGSGFRSFPSSHMAVACALMILAMMFLGDKWKWPMVGFVIMIALSRLILQKHFISDLLVGALIGEGVTTIVILLTNKHEALINQLFEVIR